MQRFEKDNFVGVMADNPQFIILMLHGYGADKNDLFSLADNYLKDFPNACFVSMDAPDVCEINPFGKQWFSLEETKGDLSNFDRNYFSNLVSDNFDYIKNNIEEICKISGVDKSKIIICGFSQGAATALGYAYSSGEDIIGVCFFSGIMLVNENKVLNKVPAFISHGDMDDIVPLSEFFNAKDFLISQGVMFDEIIIPGMGHSIDIAEIDKSIEFIKRIINDL